MNIYTSSSLPNKHLPTAERVITNTNSISNQNHTHKQTYNWIPSTKSFYEDTKIKHVTFLKRQIFLIQHTLWNLFLRSEHNTSYQNTHTHTNTYQYTKLETYILSHTFFYLTTTKPPTHLKVFHITSIS